MLCVFLCCSQDISWKGLFCKVCTAQFTCSYTVFHGSFLRILLGTKGQILDGGVSEHFMWVKNHWLHWNEVIIGKWLVQTARVNKRRGRREGKMDHLLTQKQVELHVILVKYHGSISSCFFFKEKSILLSIPVFGRAVLFCPSVFGEYCQFSCIVPCVYWNGWYQHI